MMVELIIFAVILVSLQAVSALVIGKIMMDKAMDKFMSKEFLKDYMKMTMKVTNEVMKEMEDEK